MRMRFMAVLGVGLTVVLLASVAYAQRQDSPKVTGGGQIDVATDGEGAGNTLTFFGGVLPNGMETGQVQYVPTSSGGGSAEGFWHGFVNCFELVSSDTARVSGTRVPAGETGRFWLEVTDTGVPADSTDMIRLNQESETTCRNNDNDAMSHELGRGNATVHSP